MKFFDASKEKFDLGELGGKLVAFTNMRLDRNTVPEGLYCYDVRDSDNCDGTCAEVKNGHVWVNHWGTILTKTPYEFEDGGYFYPEEDMDFFGSSITAEEMLTKSEPELWTMNRQQSQQMTQSFGS